MLHKRAYLWLVGLCLITFLWFLPATPAQASDHYVILYGPSAKVADDPTATQTFFSCYDPATYTQDGEKLTTDSIIYNTITQNTTLDLFQTFFGIANNFLTKENLANQSNVPDIQALADSYVLTATNNLTGYVPYPDEASQIKDVTVSAFPTAGHYYALLPAVAIDGSNASAAKVTVEKTDQSVTIEDANGQATSDSRTVTGATVDGHPYSQTFVLNPATYDPDRDIIVNHATDTAVTPSVYQAGILNNTIFGFKLNGFNLTLDGTKASTYSIIPKDDGYMTIHYQYTDGKEAAASQLVHGTKGTQQTITSPTIKGYTPNKATVAVTLGTTKAVTVTYQKNPDPVTPTTPTTDTSSTATLIRQIFHQPRQRQQHRPRPFNPFKFM